MTPTRRVTTTARDLKFLITSLSVAATVTGFAIFSQSSAMATANSTNQVAVAVVAATQPVTAGTTLVAATTGTASTSRTTLASASTTAPAAVTKTRSSR